MKNIFKTFFLASSGVTVGIMLPLSISILAYEDRRTFTILYLLTLIGGAIYYINKRIKNKKSKSK